MCFTSVIFDREGRQIGTLGLDVLLTAVQENKKWNDDGYALRYDDHLIRTLDEDDFVNMLLAKKDEIMQSRTIHLHLRRSTNKVSQEFIHMWEIGGWYCSHNGVLHNNKEDENDSLEFFKKCEQALQNDDADWIRRCVEMEMGYGVFLLTKKDGRSMMVISKTKDAKIEEYANKKNSIVAISSDYIKEDLHRKFYFTREFELKGRNLCFKMEKTIKKNHISFNEQFTYSAGSMENRLALIDLDNYKVEVVFNLAKEVKVKAGAIEQIKSYFNGGYDGVSYNDIQNYGYASD